MAVEKGSVKFVVAARSEELHPIKRALFDMGSEILISSETVRQTLDILRQGDVNVVIASNTLPDGDGVSLLKEIRARPEYNNVVVMLIVDKSSQDKVIEAIKAGVNELLVRPVTVNSVHSKIKNMFSKYADKFTSS